MNTKKIKAAALALGMALPTAALAANGVATGSVNMRTGPSTSYARIQTIPDGSGVNIYGCLSNRSWCDVAYAGARGWVSSNYLARLEGRRTYSNAYVGVPTISFSFGTYHDRHYRGRPWYRDRNWADNRRDYRRLNRLEQRERRIEARQDRIGECSTRAECRRLERLERRERRVERRQDRIRNRIYN